MFKKEILVLYYGLQDRQTGIGPKLMTILAVTYLLSPIDLIPDFIPFFGYLDDLILVPLMLNLAVQMLPVEVREQSMNKAAAKHQQFRWLLILIIVLLILALIGIFFLIRHFINMI